MCTLCCLLVTSVPMVTQYWSLNTEYRRRKKQHLSAKVSQWEWKPYEDERHEHVSECVVG